MRLLFRSSTVAAIVLGSTARSIASGQKRLASTSPVAENDKWSYDGIECNLAAATASANSEVVHAAETRPDVGLLAGCHPLRQVCAPDESSSLGGRCRDKVGRQRQARKQQQRQQQQQQRQRHQTPRFLQGEEFVCPATCPRELCDCAATTYYGFPDAQDCAFEVHAVCLTGDVVDCFDADYPDFYSYVYCPFAECWLAGNGDDECDCGYYRDYCDLYGDYADGYPEIAEKCAVAECCEGSCPRKNAPLLSTRMSGTAPTNPPVHWFRISTTVVTGPSEDEDEDEDSSDRFSNDGEILNMTGSSTEDSAPEGGTPAGSPTGDSPEDAVPRSVSLGTKAASESGGAGRPRTTAGRTAAVALAVAAGVWLCA